MRHIHITHYETYDIYIDDSCMRAAAIVFSFGGKLKGVLKEMQFSSVVGTKTPVLGSPVDVNGNPSKAVLSAQVYGSSDPTVFTAAPDPAVPGGAILTAVGAGTATLTETATATEPDGVTTETIQGVATILVTVAPPPPPPVAAGIVFAFGAPAPVAAP